MGNTKNKNGFSLIEVLIAILLVGLAIASLVGANSAFTQSNGAGTDLSTAEFLLEQVRELTTLLPVIDPATWSRKKSSATLIMMTWMTSTEQFFLRRLMPKEIL